MKASLAWINSYLDRPASAEEVQQRLGDVGFPVEGVDPIALASGDTDTRLEVEITSNRGDCLHHLGLARELAAATGRTLRAPATDAPPHRGNPLVRVDNRAADLCPVYTARVIRGVKVRPSPAWLIDRLQAVGLRSVNNVVDATNFVLFEMGQPLHAFDLTRLAGQTIVVRRAGSDEPFTAIDGSKHKLRDTMLVIADESRPVAVAGVMGGLDSEVSDATTDILLESAAFDPLSVRRTSRALRLASDSSYRFERGVDPQGIERASRRAAAIILELAGGEVVGDVVRAGQPEPNPATLTMRVDRCRAVLGVDLTAEAQARYLDRLGLDAEVAGGEAAGEVIRCTIPTFRRDLQREIDLIEEVARSHGMDRIDVRDRVAFTVQPRQPHVAARQTLHRVLVAHGYHEAVTFSFLPPRLATPFVPEGADAVVLDDERRRSEPVLRPSLLPSLMNCRKLNQDVGNHGVRLYEIGSTWVKREGRIVETVRLALLADAPDAHAAVRLLRGTIEELVGRLGGQGASPHIEPVDADNFTLAARVLLGDRPVGGVGLIDPATRDAVGVKTPLAAAELELQPLLALYPPRAGAVALPRFPAIERDVSWIVDESVQWRRIHAAVHSAKPAMLDSVEFLGTYRGKPIDKGRKSVSFRLLFRDPAGTLRHDQVDPQVAAVTAALAEQVGGQLRT